MLRYKQVVLRFCGDWSSLVNGLANDIHDPAQRLRSHRDSDRCTSIQNLLTTDQTLSTVHSDGAYSALPCWERKFFLIHFIYFYMQYSTKSPTLTLTNTQPCLPKAQYIHFISSE